VQWYYNTINTSNWLFFNPNAHNYEIRKLKNDALY
jgi:hypothetical protein